MAHSTGKEGSGDHFSWVALGFLGLYLIGDLVEAILALSDHTTAYAFGIAASLCMVTVAVLIFLRTNSHCKHDSWRPCLREQPTHYLEFVTYLSVACALFIFRYRNAYWFWHDNLAPKGDPSQSSVVKFLTHQKAFSVLMAMFLVLILAFVSLRSILARN